MRSPQFGKWHKGNVRRNNAALPVAERPLALPYMLGRCAPPKDKPKSRNDRRDYTWGQTPGAKWDFTPIGRYKLR